MQHYSTPSRISAWRADDRNLIARLLIQDHRDWILAVSVAIIVYGGFLFVPGMHVDDEVSAVYQHTISANLGLGRWGTSLIRLTLIPQPFNGYFTALFALCMMAASALAFARFLFPSVVARGCAIAVFIAFPQFCYQMQFHVQADVVPLGYLLAICAFILSQTGHSIRSAFLSAILATLALAIYQPIILFVICMASCLCIRSAFDQASIRSAIRPIVTTSILLAVALIAYLAISRSLMYLFDIANGASYFQDQFVWNRRPVGQTVTLLGEVLGGMFSARTYYGESLYGISVLPWSIIVVAALKLPLQRLLLVWLIATALLLLPYAIVILMGQPQPARVFVVQGACAAGLWGLALERASWLARLRTTIAVGVAAYVAACAFHASRLAFTDYIQWRADISTGTRLMTNIYAAYPDFDEQAQPIYVYGAYRRENFWRGSNYDVFGQSFFAWDGGNTDRIAAFLTASGIADLSPATPRAQAGLNGDARRMPVWPRAGSIKLVGNVLILRLGQ